MKNRDCLEVYLYFFGDVIKNLKKICINFLAGISPANNSLEASVN